ncbi:MAG: TetR/AcrR family transcriptional regulator [Pseudobutyrivibrio ruminis]|uniref:TetR/AcrR family transcriptional regulator n=1 Tax=Pseudobutyrivibrio ruminis TaxID=46206 RepID=UPI0026F26065|nr:TetR/AcrR family transcriptional regulator [Pseudobutyrivibrio ruminis]MBE5915100.1 TetR/AcrR family transcriptional regulator [Pseudobutyrivibrio ruminis]
MSEYVTSSYGEALFSLMKEKNIEKITVDELCEKGGIGRATYFRNFKSKDEIITAYIVMKWREYEQKHKLKEHQLNDSYRVKRYFDFCYSMGEKNDLIINQGHKGAILAAYETIVTNSDIGEDSDTYESYYLAYGLFGIFIKWAINGYTESTEDMTKIVVGLVS